MDVVTILQKVTEEVCDNPCKYPDMFNVNIDDAVKADENMAEMFEKHCNVCPLNKIWGGHTE